MKSNPLSKKHLQKQKVKQDSDEEGNEGEGAIEIKPLDDDEEEDVEGV